jgi:hypothetical protein
VLRFILFDTTLFGDGDKDVHETRQDLMWIQEALVKRNQNYLKQRPNSPPLYRSGVKYMLPNQFDGEPEEVSVLRAALGNKLKDPKVASVLDTCLQVFGGERFRDIGRIIENGGGDCDNLAAWRVAELRQAGIEAMSYMTNRRRMDGGTTYHALVLWPPFANVPYVTSEDPSLLLGMSQPDRKADRDEEIRKNVERCDLIRRYGVKPVAGAPSSSFEADVEDVLGLRRRFARYLSLPPDVAEVSRISRRGV